MTGGFTKLELAALHAIFAETPDSFYLTVVPATLEFAPGEVAPTLVLNQNGQEIEFTRAP